MVPQVHIRFHRRDHRASGPPSVPGTAAGHATRLSVGESPLVMTPSGRGDPPDVPAPGGHMPIQIAATTNISSYGRKSPIAMGVDMDVPNEGTVVIVIVFAGHERAPAS